MQSVREYILTKSRYRRKKLNRKRKSGKWKGTNSC